MVTSLHLPTLIHDAVVAILWIVVFGIFRHKFYRGDSADNDGGLADRMRSAVWVDLANFGLWMFTFAWCGLRWWKSRRQAKKAEEKVEGNGGYYMNDV